jgi:ankyrin repeat protein
MLAAQFGRLTTVTTLLAVSDIEVNCADEGGNTALMLASRNGHIGVVRALLAFNKIKINSTNKNGESAIALAFEHRHPNIISLLEEKGAIIPEDLRQINCAAHLAAPSPGVTFSYTADTEEKKLQSCSLAVECNAGLGKKKKTKKN